MKTNDIHTFHIPVMGLAYTIDTPIRVAQYGISSVISIADDDLIEKMNAFYSKKFQLPYQEITQKVADYRAKRITSYLNLVDHIVTQKVENFKLELAKSKETLDSYLEMLPNTSDLKKSVHHFIQEGLDFKESVQNYIETQLCAGAIDVNIMTKLDKDNFVDNVALPVEFNDAHAALRGFANSNLSSSVVLSAGMNPRLFAYFENFDVFFPSKDQPLKKKITLKVSDYRSALIQGNFLAKKGLWVSEYRIESGLNCGGHAFATDGFLLGPILEEFKEKKAELQNTVHELLSKTLESKGKYVPEKPLPIKITVQGGVGTAEEHDFLLQHYEVDSVGWGSPFLLVPEATSVDAETRELLAKSKEEDLYLSNISPLGVPFNTVRGSSNENFKQKRIDQNKAGSSCPKKFLALSKEMGPEGICTASKKYQDHKLGELELEKANLDPQTYEFKKEAITEKSCLCVGLANASYLENDMPIKGQAQGVVICPGPNMAYFDQEVSLSNMVQHIYGNKSVLRVDNRPHMFVKELKMYVDYFKKDYRLKFSTANAKELKKLEAFRDNLITGIQYYENLFKNVFSFTNEKSIISNQLNTYRAELLTITF
ncbi:hypothetical protein [Flavobacterium sp. TAB 87]|uniref:hypothetical protein n=1 Tax=Flavobacterium sp. TAB 87 TaxID=1729581 RepID=UPI00076DA7DA|nr:hypothetical protein [Flavobacterium sp. TAB 87]KVV13132.1 hypothetical protein AP058_02494 [Flavobacterium sp. TAB 87]